MKVTNVLKIASVSVLVMMMAGCATSMNVSAKKQMSDYKKEGVVYGYLLSGFGATSKLTPVDNIKDICNSIDNKDSRCSEPDRYVTAPIESKWGYSDGVVGIIAIADKSTIKLNKPCLDGRSSSCTYYKVVVEKDRLPTITEAASLPGEDKCKWTFMAVGGTSCPAYNWTYTKDNEASIVLQ